MIVVNEPLPHQLTVGRLRELLREIPESTVVGIAVPPSLCFDPRLTLYFNVRISYCGGPVLKLVPTGTETEEGLPG